MGERRAKPNVAFERILLSISWYDVIQVQHHLEKRAEAKTPPLRVPAHCEPITSQIA